ncbi:MAG: ATP-binding protein [Acidobacteria bacterium]|nr:ATP-binding protein [Acidobacteriota bacterium]
MQETATETQSLLFIDDDPETYHLLAPFLSQHGLRLERAASASEGLDRLQATAFDLVLMDLKFAGDDHSGLLHHIRVLRPHARIVVITGEHAPANVICAIRERAFQFFSKPFSPAAVADAIGQALQTESWADDIEIISASPQWITFQVRCKIQAADRLVQFLRELKMDLPPGMREDIAMALRELLLNAIEHGGRMDPQKRLRISCVRSARAIMYHIQDPGPGFSFQAISHAAVANPPDQPARHVEIREEQGVRPGGFGILVSRNLADELLYNEKGNEVLFIKYL